MFRVFSYLGLGWLLIAAVPGLASVLGLTIMLPAPTAIVMCHIAFRRDRMELWFGLFLACCLGYLEDLHQGSPIGTLMLAHNFAFLFIYWVSQRLALPGVVSRVLASSATVVALDLISLLVLLVFADSFDLRVSTLFGSLSAVGWHALATGLFAHPVWWLFDRVESLFDVVSGSRLGGERKA